MKRLSLSIAREVAQARGGDCLSSEYINSRQSLKWTCAKGHEWDSKARNVITEKSWCPECAGKRHSLEEFCLLAKSRGGFCLSKEYLGMQKKLTWKCSHGHIWDATPAGVLISGSWCPECSAGISERLVKETFEQLFQKPFPKVRPKWMETDTGIKLELDGYNESLKIAFEHQGKQHYEMGFFHKDNSSLEKRKAYDDLKRLACKRHNVLLVEIPQIKHGRSLEDLKSQIIKELKRSGIRSIPGEHTQFNYQAAYLTNGSQEFLELLKNKVSESKGVLLENQYKGSKGLHLLRCSEGHEWEATADSIMRGKWCRFCSAGNKAKKFRRSLDSIISLAKEHKGKLISTSYKNSKLPLEWQCSQGHEWIAPLNNILGGKWCPECAKWSTSEIIKVAKDRGGEVFINKVKPPYSKCLLTWQCKAGHRWVAKLNSILHGTWCPECAGNKPKLIDDMYELARKKNGFCLSDVYVNAKTKLNWLCKNNHKWYATPSSIKSGSWCPECAGKKKIFNGP